MRKITKFASAFFDHHDRLVANHQKRKKGFNHHDARRLAREAMFYAALQVGGAKYDKEFAGLPYENERG